VIEAPHVAKRRKYGQFCIVRWDEHSERVPLSIIDVDRQAGTITLVVQVLGHSSRHLADLSAGDQIADVLGPLGQPTHLENFGRAAFVGGGIGVACGYPLGQGLNDAGNHLATIIGFRTKELIIFEDELRAISDDFLIATDDGSYGRHGFVTVILQEYLAEHPLDFVLCVGPVPMMRAVAEVTRPLGVRTMVSLNPIMVDGTGMCGGCRVEVGGQTRFACVDGPEFDAHDVNFELLSQRSAMYRPLEQEMLAETAGSPTHYE
jgi:ferredoxin--NADP+ reductase